MVKRVWHRVTQFWCALRAPLWPVDRAFAQARLSAPLLALFESMSRVEQQHGIAVCQALEQRGITDADAQIAALLHDVGKSVAPPYLWDRVLVVLGEWLLPKHAARWSAAATPRGLTRGFVIRRRHAEWGAALAEQAGAAPRAVALIRLHHHTGNIAPARGKDFRTLLRTLQAIDDA